MSYWPLVDPNDDGIRPAGKPDECFYCNSKVGEEHGRQCCIVTKLVRLEYTFRQREQDGCSCQRFSAKFIKVLSEIPVREIREATAGKES